MFRFFDLPPEIRELVYAEVLSARSSKHFPPRGLDIPPWYRHDLSLLSVSRLVHAEATKVFRETNIFVKVSTPWATALDHINTVGKVPVVAHGQRAQAFTNWHLNVKIDARDYDDRSEQGSVNMLFCVEDLPAFAALWRWSQLSNQNELNHFLHLNIELQNPWAPGQQLSQGLQEQLLLPFGIVRELKDFLLEGNVYPSIKRKLAELQKVVEPTMEECFEEGFRLKDEGNDLVTAGKLEEALELYRRSFAAIWITIKGRQREVHSETFFSRTIRSGQWKGHSGTAICLLLRCRLVANIVLTYLKLGDFREAHFWGKRSIILFRQALVDAHQIGDPNIPEPYWTDEQNDVDIVTGTSTRPTSSSSTASIRQPDDGRAEESFLDDIQAFIYTNNFPAGTEMGKIFYRTAMASKQLGKTGDVRTMIRAAHVLLPKDEVVLAEKKKLDMEDEERKWVRNEAPWLDPMDVDEEDGV